MASAPQQQQTQEERDEIKLGQEQTQHARTQSAPLQAEYRKKMNRDDGGRLSGMATADVMQAAGTDRTGQQLASGQGGGHSASGLGGQLQQATSNAGIAALDRQDGLKSNYNALGNKKNVNAVASLKSSAGAASHVAAGEADAAATRQAAMLDGLTGVAGAYGLKQYDKWDTANSALKKGIKGKHPFAERWGDSEITSLRTARDGIKGAKAFNWMDKRGF
jgi:hypothetical protein